MDHSTSPTPNRSGHAPDASQDDTSKTTIITKIKQNPGKAAAASVLLLSLLLAGFIIWPEDGGPAQQEQHAEHAEGEQAGEDGTHAAEEGDHAGEEGRHAAEEGEHAEGGHAETISFSPEQVERFGIQTSELEEGRATSVLSRPATALFDPDRTAAVGPRVEAKVVRVLQDLGDEVQRGEPLAIMSSVELGQAKSAFLTARARLETAEASYEREQKLFEQEITSEAELLEARASYSEARADARAAAETLRLYGLTERQIEGIGSGGSGRPFSQFALVSPMSGTVQQRDLGPGQSVSPSETPIHVASTDELWVMIDAYERDVPYLEEGLPVVLEVRSLPGKTFRGTTDWVSYELDPETRTLEVRARVDNVDGQLRAGMFGTARIQTESEVIYPVVPEEAVQQIGERQIVFVPGDKGGEFRPVEVQTGESAGGLVELRAGLQPGDVVVTSGAFDLKSALTSATRSAAHSH